jgi:hypothetical protein
VTSTLSVGVEAAAAADGAAGAAGAEEAAAAVAADGEGGAVVMPVVFPDGEGDEARLERCVFPMPFLMPFRHDDADFRSMCHRLLAKALELEHPGIDPEGIETMKGFIAAGRFPHSHYIKMWSKRLEEMGVVSSVAVCDAWSGS